jgi:hypothetical protein
MSMIAGGADYRGATEVRAGWVRTAYEFRQPRASKKSGSALAEKVDYSGFQMRATQLERLRPRRQSLAGVSR